GSCHRFPCRAARPPGAAGASCPAHRARSAAGRGGGKGDWSSGVWDFALARLSIHEAYCPPRAAGSVRKTGGAMKPVYLATLCIGIAAAALPAAAQNVKITPLGSHDGEFCPFDRAMIFEDPDGTRILYDAGRTVRGAKDPRLGKIDAILLSHVHGDHLGDLHQPSANAGECAKPYFSVSAVPNSNTVNIAIEKQAPMIAGGEMSAFLIAKVKGLGGDPAKLVRLVRFGASTMIGKVMVAGVPAVHSNGLAPRFLEKEKAPVLG